MNLKQGVESIGLADLLSHALVGCVVVGALLLLTDLPQVNWALTLAVAIMASLVVTAVWRAFKGVPTKAR